MKRKLFGYMFVLTAILIILIVAGLSLTGRFDSTDEHTYNALNIQLDVFEKDVSESFDRIAAAGISLSSVVSDVINGHLAEWKCRFEDLNDSADRLNAVQSTLIPILKQKMLQENCSGTFVILDATINTRLETAETSRSGIYMKANGYRSTDNTIILYHGDAETAAENGLDLHRKWLLEFSTKVFPNYDDIVALANKSTDDAYFLTELCTIPGTSDNVVLMAVPVRGENGKFIGICGFEISESYFAAYFAQPPIVEHLTCLLSPENGGTIDSARSLSCGLASGYYRVPDGIFSVNSLKNGLYRIVGERSEYVGISRNIGLTPNNGDYIITAMLPKSDYDSQYFRDIMRTVILWSLLVFCAVSMCAFFSKRFLSPILKGLEAIKSGGRQEISSPVPEINDLFKYLAEQDKYREKTLSELEGDMLEAREEARRLHLEYEKAKADYELAEKKYTGAQLEIERLAYDRKTEVDPDNYQVFLDGIETLTATEKKIFEYYLAGKTVKEIIEISQIKESTLRFHNKNIYSKLGVNSLKQLLRYAAMNREHSTADV